MKPLAFAWISCSSGEPALLPAANPFASYYDWALSYVPRVERFGRFGLTGVFLHNPGGQHHVPYNQGDARPMRVDAWEMSERRRYPFADREDFRAAVHVLRRAGVTEVIVYTGAPTQLLDPIRELPQVLDAFTDCGPIVSFAFDAMFENGVVGIDGAPHRWQELWAERSPYRTAVTSLRAKGHKVYAEARLHPAQLAAGLGKLVDGTVAEAAWDDTRGYDLTKQPGRKLRATYEKTWEQHQEYAGWPEVDAWDPSILPIYCTKLNWGPHFDRPEVK